MWLLLPIESDPLLWLDIYYDEDYIVYIVNKNVFGGLNYFFAAVMFLNVNIPSHIYQVVDI